MINEHEKSWLGHKVKPFTEDNSEEAIEDADKVIYRVTLTYDAELSFSELFARFTSNASVSETPGIIIGQFFGEAMEGDTGEVVRLLVSARDRLQALRGIFLPEVISEETEISWIRQSDLSPLFDAYPNLEHLRVRGSDGLAFGTGVRHEGLKSLIIETGGLPPAVLQQVASCQFPALEHLELWLGTSGYGGDGTVNDLKPFLDGGQYPKLKHLGLRDSEIADAVATELAKAPVLSKIETLDLSLGTLSDEGGEALLRSEPMRNLQAIDLHHHYLSNGMMARLRQTFRNVNVSDQQKGDEDDRYVAVSE